MSEVKLGVWANNTGYQYYKTEEQLRGFRHLQMAIWLKFRRNFLWWKIKIFAEINEPHFSIKTFI